MSRANRPFKHMMTRDLGHAVEKTIFVIRDYSMVQPREMMIDSALKPLGDLVITGPTQLTIIGEVLSHEITPKPKRRRRK